MHLITALPPVELHSPKSSWTDLPPPVWCLCYALWPGKSSDCAGVSSLFRDALSAAAWCTWT